MPQKRFVYEIIQREFLPVNYYKSYVKVDFLEYFHENIYIYFFRVIYRNGFIKEKFTIFNNYLLIL